MKNMLRTFAAVLLIASFAVADWSDNFDSYANGSGLHGQGNWQGWENDPAFDAYVTDAYSMSSPHSVSILPTSDIVQPFSETTGEWEMSAWHYIPSGHTGEQYFILCNTYPTAYSEDWSLQIKFDGSGTATIVETGTTFPFIYDQWIEVKVYINLNTDMQSVYYNGVFIEELNWSSGGAWAIGCLDLFSNGGSTIYWDDCELATASALEHSTWGQIKAISF